MANTMFDPNNKDHVKRLRSLPLISCIPCHYCKEHIGSVGQATAIWQNSTATPPKPEFLQIMHNRCWTEWDGVIVVAGAIPLASFLANRLIDMFPEGLDEIEVDVSELQWARVKKLTDDLFTYSEVIPSKSIPPSLRFQILKRDNYRCQLCGASAKDDVRLHVDHIIPRAKGGTDAITNLQTLCELCNLGKSDEDL